MIRCTYPTWSPFRESKATSASYSLLARGTKKKSRLPVGDRSNRSNYLTSATLLDRQTSDLSSSTFVLLEQDVRAEVEFFGKQIFSLSKWNGRWRTISNLNGERRFIKVVKDLNAVVFESKTFILTLELLTIGFNSPFLLFSPIIRKELLSLNNVTSNTLSFSPD